MSHTNVGSPEGFKSLADRAVADIEFDSGAALAQASRLGQSRRTRRRRLLLGTPAALALAGVAVLVPFTIGGTGPSPAAAYETGVTSTDEPLTVLDQGLALHYLPDGDQELSLLPEYSYPADTSPGGLVIFATSCYGNEDSTVTVCLAQEPGLDVERYLQNNWFEGTETTVDGRPALINGLTADGAGGIVFSPRDGIVLEIGVDSELADELRTIVEGITLPPA